MTSPDRHFWLAFVPIWSVLLLVTLVWGGSLYNSFVYANAAGRQKITAGTIVGYRPEDHARYDYTFAANGTNYTGRDYYLGGSEGARAVGQKVDVYYDPTSPRTNSLSDLKDSAVFALPIAAWLFAALLFNGIAYLDWKRRRNNASYS
jgi:hypothetical protein